MTCIKLTAYHAGQLTKEENAAEGKPAVERSVTPYWGKENTTLFGRGIGKEKTENQLQISSIARAPKKIILMMSKINPRMSPFRLSIDSMILS